MKKAIMQLWRTLLLLRRVPYTLLFLIASAIYNDGISVCFILLFFPLKHVYYYPDSIESFRDIRNRGLKCRIFHSSQYVQVLFFQTKYINLFNRMLMFFVYSFSFNHQFRWYRRSIFFQLAFEKNWSENLYSPLVGVMVRSCSIQ
jgi:hypothetical protein